jgi:hypothetical protein
MYPFEDAIDDGPIYGGRLSPPLGGFQGDPHSNLDGIIQRAQGVVTSLTLSIPSLQQLCDRYNAVNDELQRYYQIAAEQDKDIEELQAKERQLEALKENMEQNLQMNTAEINRLKLKIADLEFEVKRLNASIEGKEKERVAFEEKFNQEREALEQEFQKWKEETLTAHDSEKASLVQGHDAEKILMEKAFVVEKRSLEDIHSAKTMDLETTHADKVKDLEVGHETKLRELEELHEAKVQDLEVSYAAKVKQVEELFAEEKKGMQDLFVEEKKDMENVFAAEKLRVQEEFASEKQQMIEDFSSQRKGIEDDFANQKTRLHDSFENEKKDMISSFETAKTEWGEEKEKIISDFKDEKSRLDEIIKGLEHDKQVLEDIKVALEVDKTGLEGEKAVLLDEKSTLFVEKTTLLGQNSTLIEEKTLLLDEKSSLLDEKSTLLSEKAMLQEQKIDLEGAVTTLEDKTATLQGDKETLISQTELQRSEWESEKVRLQEMIGLLENDKNALLNDNNKLVETLKEVAEEEEGSEIRSRGDCFYIDAFQKLAKDIVDISSEFSNLPISPPSKVIAELPSSLPSMLGNSDASRLIRMAYVQHIISKYLCYRIFQPFLFSLGKRYDKADTFFQSMSNQLREKSTRKEAVWRHYTLLAGYTASNAKKNAGVAASSVIEEIAGYVKPFSDQQNMDIITSGISRIVKFAVETWRYARMEREIITASMSMDDTKGGTWECHSYENQSPYLDNVLLTSQLQSATADHVMILPLLPVFSREGTLPTLHRPLAVLDGGLVFSKGTALYSTCLPVLHRRYELNLLQLPYPMECVAQLESDHTFEEVQEEIAITEARNIEMIQVVGDDAVREHESSKMEDEAEKEIGEALREAEMAVALVKAIDLEAPQQVEETGPETIEDERENSLSIDALTCEAKTEFTTVEVVTEVEDILEQSVYVEVAVDEKTTPQVVGLAGDGEAEVKIVEMEATDVAVEPEEKVEIEDKCKVDNVETREGGVADLGVSEDALIEGLAPEPVVDGADIEKASEQIVEAEELPKQEGFATETTGAVAENFIQTEEEPIDHIVDITEAHVDVGIPAEAPLVEDAAEIKVNGLLLTLATSEEATMLVSESVVTPELTEAGPEMDESEPPAVAATVEDVNPQTSAPNEELKEPKSPKSSRKSKLPKKLGPKKTKK